MSESKGMIELMLCALLQGFCVDLNPVFELPQLPLSTYLELRGILRNEKIK